MSHFIILTNTSPPPFAIFINTIRSLHRILSTFFINTIRSLHRILWTFFINTITSIDRILWTFFINTITSIQPIFWTSFIKTITNIHKIIWSLSVLYYPLSWSILFKHQCDLCCVLPFSDTFHVGINKNAMRLRILSRLAHRFSSCFCYLLLLVFRPNMMLVLLAARIKSHHLPKEIFIAHSNSFSVPVLLVLLQSHIEPVCIMMKC